jgi:hypothetical protein
VPKPANTSPLGPSVASTTLGQTSARPVIQDIPSASSQQPEYSKKSNKKSIIFIVAFLLLLIIGGGAFWYFAYGQTMLMTRQMVLKIEAPYQNYVSNFEFVMDIREQKNSASQTMDNPANMFLPKSDNTKVDLKGLMHVVDKNFDGNYTFDISSGPLSIKNGIDFKQIDQNIYFKC